MGFFANTINDSRQSFREDFSHLTEPWVKGPELSADPYPGEEESLRTREPGPDQQDMADDSKTDSDSVPFIGYPENTELKSHSVRQPFLSKVEDHYPETGEEEMAEISTPLTSFPEVNSHFPVSPGKQRILPSTDQWMLEAEGTGKEVRVSPTHSVMGEEKAAALKTQPEELLPRFIEREEADAFEGSTMEKMGNGQDIHLWTNPSDITKKSVPDQRRGYLTSLLEWENDPESERFGMRSGSEWKKNAPPSEKTVFDSVGEPEAAKPGPHPETTKIFRNAGKPTYSNPLAVGHRGESVKRTVISKSSITGPLEEQYNLPQRSHNPAENAFQALRAEIGLLENRLHVLENEAKDRTDGGMVKSHPYAKKPPEPLVHIGQVEIIIEAPRQSPSPTQSSGFGDTAGEMESRLYIRRI